MTIEEAIEEQIEDNAEEIEEHTEQTEGEPEFSDEEQQAYRQGWRPKEEWVESGKSEANWIEADKFLEFDRERTQKKRINFLEDELKKIKADTSKTMQEQQAAFKRNLELQKSALIEQYDAKIRTAVEEGDTDTYDQLEAAKREAVGQFDEPVSESTDDASQDPKVAAWAKENPWMRIDPDANKLAAVTFETFQIRNPDAPITDALKAVEKKVSKKYPEYFDDDEGEPEPTRKQNNGKERTMEDVQKVSTGNRAGTTRKKSGVSALSTFDRGIGEGFVRDGLFKDLDAYAAYKEKEDLKRDERAQR